MITRRHVLKAIATESVPQIKSFLLVQEAAKTIINDQVEWWGYIGRVICVSFFKWVDVS